MEKNKVLSEQYSGNSFSVDKYLIFIDGEVVPMKLSFKKNGNKLEITKLADLKDIKDVRLTGKCQNIKIKDNSTKEIIFDRSDFFLWDVNFNSEFEEPDTITYIYSNEI